MRLLPLTVTAGTATLDRIAETARSTARGELAYIARRAVEPGVAEVLGCAGGAPQNGERIPIPVVGTVGRLVLPLVMDGTPLGWLVVDGAGGGQRAQVQRELALLAAMGAIALQNATLVSEVEQRDARAAARHYRLMSGTVYHLKNALAVASEYSELAASESPLTPVQASYAERSRRSISMAMRLLSELHELGRADAGEVKPVREPFAILPLLRDIVGEYRLASGAAGVRVELEAHELPPVDTDPDCVRQVLDTLVSNAVRYSPSDGRVTVRASMVDGRRASDPSAWLRVDVHDEGPGVAEDEDVFDEVARVERKGAPGFRLAIARRISKLLDGDLTLDTGAAGTTFSLWLPAVRPD